jgi:hypothetical protein
MRIIEIINKSMEYNSLLVKWIKGSLWFEDNTIPENEKEKQYTRFAELQKQIANMMNELEMHGITFKDYEAIECIEIPEQLKRKDVEIWLENWFEYKNKKAV